MPTPLVIAVFGGSKGASDHILSWAEHIGSEIARRKHVVLSGSTGPGHRSVKDRTVKGAIGHWWIGVAKRPPPGTRPTGKPADTYTSPDGRGLVITTSLGDRRNYLEAWMCDAAVALPGREGTLSEAVFSLSLSRPIAFVGDGWTDLYRALKARDASSLAVKVRNAITHVGGPSSFVDEEIINAGVQTSTSATTLRSIGLDTEDPARILDWIEDNTMPDTGSFPDIEGHSEVGVAYTRWLANARGTSG